MTRPYLSAIAVATALSLSACADSVSAPVGLTPSSAAAAITTAAVTLTPEKLVSSAAGRSVNEKGEVAGQGVGLACGPGSSAGLPRFWRADGTLVNLPVGSHCAGNSHSISNSGFIVGLLSTPAASALWTPNATGGYDLQELEFVNGYRVEPFGVNDGGEIVGFYADLYYRTPSTPWTLIPRPAGSTNCQVRSINNSGAIVGACRINGGPLTGFYWANHDAAPIALPRPAATGNITVKDINDAGVCVGWIALSTGGFKAVRWTPNADGGYNVEYLPDAGRGAAAHSVSRDGTVVGNLTKTSSTGTPAIWPTSGGYQVLPTLGKNYQNSEAFDVATSAAGTPIVVGHQDSQGLRWK